MPTGPAPVAAAPAEDAAPAEVRFFIHFVLQYYFMPPNHVLSIHDGVVSLVSFRLAGDQAERKDRLQRDAREVRRDCKAQDHQGDQEPDSEHESHGGSSLFSFTSSLLRLA